MDYNRTKDLVRMPVGVTPTVWALVYLHKCVLPGFDSNVTVPTQLLKHEWTKTTVGGHRFPSNA